MDGMHIHKAIQQAEQTLPRRRSVTLHLRSPVNLSISLRQDIPQPTEEGLSRRILPRRRRSSTQLTHRQGAVKFHQVAVTTYGRRLAIKLSLLIFDHKATAGRLNLPRQHRRLLRTPNRLGDPSTLRQNQGLPLRHGQQPLHRPNSTCL